jgi:gamma-glutamylcyclotransferase (GGCT)/AIG2-like uncharacterized protein YtfP
MTPFLFAYGTLQPARAPQEIRDVLKKIRPVGKAVAHGILYDLGEYPGAVFGDQFSDSVKGQVFRLPHGAAERDTLLHSLDEYEGVNLQDPSRGLFVRRQLPVLLRNGRKITCWAYEYAGERPKEPPIFDGLYVGPRKNRRTSSRRFRSNPKVTQ